MDTGQGCLHPNCDLTAFVSDLDAVAIIASMETWKKDEKAVKQQPTLVISIYFIPL